MAIAHHFDELGRFQSDQYPDLGPDEIVVSFKDPLARGALAMLAASHNHADHVLASDIRRRLATVVHE